MNDSFRMFNKSFNDLHFLESMSKDNDKKVFVFDFDLTMTCKSSDGYSKNVDYVELFDNKEKIDKLKVFFERIVRSGNVIYINTRALISDIKFILSKIGFEIGENKLIKEIKGSETVQVISCPFNLEELEKYNLINISNSKILWGIKKVTFLNIIMEQEKTKQINILFFDDSSININTAKLNGFSNSFLIGSNDSGLYGLDYLLIKLEQILFLFNI